MKNLLIYINPINKTFSSEHDDLTKIQIDNSLELGWDAKDIILVTNFSYEYAGVNSIVVNDYTVFDQDRSTKVPAINELFERRLIEDKQVYWFHDHDAFQLAPFKLKLDADAAFTTHGAFNPVLWNAGSFFFSLKAKDIFTDIWECMNQRRTNEQNALTYMWQNNINNINNRYILLDPSYNLGIYKIPENIKLSHLPLKVAHFHPHKRRHLELFTSRNILPNHLLTIFSKYGIR